MVARNHDKTRDKASGITRKFLKPRKGTKFPGIKADARALGVNRVTLYRALTKKWHLPGLLARYRKLKGEAQ